MEDLKYRHNHKIDGYLTAGQEADILALHDSPNGQILDLPTDYPRYERQRFETRIPVPNKYGSMLMINGYLPSISIVLFFTASSSPLASCVLLAFSPLVSATYGRSFLNLRNRSIKVGRNKYNDKISAYETNIQRGADEAVRVNLVKDADAIVRAGDAISMVQLAKLVTFDDHHFYQACDKLAITVLQAKAAVLMSKGLVQEFNIATYYSCDLAAAPLIPNSAREGITHEKLLRLALEHQFNNLQYLETETDKEEAEQTTPAATAEETPQKSWGLKPVYNWFAKGLKAHIDIFRKVSADDHLPEIRTALTVAEIPYDPNFGEILKSHHKKIWRPDDRRFDYLDLPAINGAGRQLRVE